MLTVVIKMDGWMEDRRLPMPGNRFPHEIHIRDRSGLIGVFRSLYGERNIVWDTFEESEDRCVRYELSKYIYKLDS